jgi:hypothetical protein
MRILAYLAAPSVSGARPLPPHCKGNTKPSGAEKRTKAAEQTLTMKLPNHSITVCGSCTSSASPAFRLFAAASSRSTSRSAWDFASSAARKALSRLARMA